MFSPNLNRLSSVKLKSKKYQKNYKNKTPRENVIIMGKD